MILFVINLLYVIRIIASVSFLHCVSIIKATIWERRTTRYIKKSVKDHRCVLLLAQLHQYHYSIAKHIHDIHPFIKGIPYSRRDNGQ